MVGCLWLTDINCWLRQIKSIEKDFGGVSVILMGNFCQLAPVGDRLLWKPDGNLSRIELDGMHLFRE